jgi:nucleoid DNA-binding protein
MNNKQFIHELSNRTSYTLEDTQRMVYDMIDSMNEKFMEGEPVNVTGFGTFEVKKRMERVIVNPSTGQRMLVPPKLVLSFKPNASVREKINHGGQQNG